MRSRARAKLRASRVRSCRGELPASGRDQRGQVRPRSSTVWLGRSLRVPGSESPAETLSASADGAAPSGHALDLGGGPALLARVEGEGLRPQLERPARTHSGPAAHSARHPAHARASVSTRGAPVTVQKRCGETWSAALARRGEAGCGPGAAARRRTVWTPLNATPCSARRLSRRFRGQSLYYGARAPQEGV